MAMGETTILTKELLSDAAVTVANVWGKLGSDDDHCAVCSAATDKLIGIIQQTATAAEQTMRLVLVGIADLKLGDSVTRGDRLTSDASGYGVTATAGQNSGGWACASGVSGDIIPVLVAPQTLSNAAGVDGHSFVNYAMATYDFDVDGGDTGDIALGVTIPDNAIIIDGLLDIITPCVSVSDNGTIALKAQTAGDLLDTVDADTLSGVEALIPVGTAATAIKLTAARELTLTIATNDLTAGKFIVLVMYIMSI